MEFVDMEFPRRIAFQATAEAQWMTQLTALNSGFEATNQNWSQTRHAYDVGLAIRTASDYLQVKTHFHAMRGRAKSFPFLDPIDYKVSQAAGVLIASGPNFQMFYRYGPGAGVYDRKITRPRSATIAIFRTRAGVTSDVTGSSTIDYTTGVVTIDGTADGDTYAWAGEFFVPCRYDVDRLPGAIVDKQSPGRTNPQLLVTCDSIPMLEVRE